MTILFQYILRGHSNIDMLAYQVKRKFNPRALLIRRLVLAVLQHPSKGWQATNKIGIWTYQLEQFYNQVILNQR